MKHFSLVWAGLWRRPPRTAFTILSIVVAFVLFGALQGLNYGFARTIADSHLDRLLTDLRVPGGAPLPISALRRIEEVAGVQEVAPRATLMGYYQEPKNTIGLLATDPERWFRVRTEFEISPQHMAALRNTRTGMIVTPELLRYFGWKIGDKIPFTARVPARDGGSLWTFDIVGTFDTRIPSKQYLTMINYDYLDENRAIDRGTAERFIVLIADPMRSVETAAAIDRLFANSGHETRTRSERESAESRLKQLGDVQFLANATVGAVLFTLLFLTANTMIQSVRQRTAEYAVLKTVGFSDRRLLALIVAEAVVLCLTGALTGLALAALLAPSLVPILGPVALSGLVIGAGIAAALVLAFLSASIPAWRVAQLRVVDALARR